MRCFEEISKAQNPEYIHPSDKKYYKALDKRQQLAKQKGRFVIRYFFMHALHVYAHLPYVYYKIQ